MSENTSKKRKLSLPLVLAGGVSSLVLALGMSPTFSAFTASITNNANNAGTGTLSMAETTTGTSPVTCNSNVSGTANCATNKYGGSTTMVPGTAVATDITIKNTGTVAAQSFTLAFGACTNTPTAVDLCSKMLVEVKSGTGSTAKVLTPANSTAKTLADLTAPIDIKTVLGGSPIAGGTGAVAIPFTITVTMPTGTGDNAYQGAQISQAMTWSFQS